MGKRWVVVVRVVEKDEFGPVGESQELPGGGWLRVQTKLPAGTLVVREL